jgi:shikimate dehydrogenase
MREGDARLLEPEILHEGQAVFDIVYNRETHLLQDARAAGAVALDGVTMLVHQGARALQIWTGRQAPLEVMEKAVREALAVRRAKISGKMKGAAGDIL